MQITRDVIERMNANALYRTVGIELIEAADGEALSVLVPRPETCWPFPQQPHGGMLFTQMDTTMAWAVQSALQSGLSCTTVDLNIHYILPARGGRFSCRARVVHQTGRLSFVRAEITAGDDRIISAGQAAFRIIKMDFV